MGLQPIFELLLALAQAGLFLEIEPAGHAGGPLVEATHGKLGFTAPLSAITAAVVGVILNLAVLLAYHVLWPQGLGGAFDLASALIGVAAAVALFRFKVGVMPLLGACALAGLAVRWALPG